MKGSFRRALILAFAGVFVVSSCAALFSPVARRVYCRAALEGAARSNGVIVRLSGLRNPAPFDAWFDEASLLFSDGQTMVSAPSGRLAGEGFGKGRLFISLHEPVAGEALVKRIPILGKDLLQSGKSFFEGSVEAILSKENGVTTVHILRSKGSLGSVKGRLEFADKKLRACDLFVQLPPEVAARWPGFVRRHLSLEEGSSPWLRVVLKGGEATFYSGQKPVFQARWGI